MKEIKYTILYVSVRTFVIKIYYGSGSGSAKFCNWIAVPVPERHKVTALQFRFRYTAYDRYICGFILSKFMKYSNVQCSLFVTGNSVVTFQAHREFLT